MNEPAKIIFTRHGTRQDFIDKEWINSVTDKKDIHDPPLAEIGIQEAAALGNRLKEFNIDYIFTSPLQRCIQTANEIAKQQNSSCVIRLEKGLLEFLGPEKEAPIPKENIELYKLSEFIDKEYQCETKGGPDFETIEQVHERCKNTVQLLSNNYSDKIILLVSHAATKIALVRGLINRDFKVNSGVCSLTVLEKNQNEYKVILNGSCEHLETLGKPQYCHCRFDLTKKIKGGEKFVWQFPE